MTVLNEHFIIGAFADYYQELVMAKTAIASGKFQDYLGSNSISSNSIDADVLGAIYKKLKAKLTKQQRFIRANTTAFEQHDYLKVLYAACVITDEQFLFDVDWGGQKNQQKLQQLWQDDYLLERSFFKTEDAGFSVYEKIDEILKERVNDNNRSDLIAVYLLLLTLGFRGKYRTSIMRKSKQLEETKRKLYRALDKPLDQDQIFAQAYQHLLAVTEDPNIHRMAPLKRWYQYSCYAVIAYLLLSSIIWLSLTAGLKDEVESLISSKACTPNNSSADSTVDASRGDGSC